MNFLDTLINIIDDSIDESAENKLSVSGFIKKWYNKDIDSYKTIIEQWFEWVWVYQKKIIEETWIQNLKIKYTGNIGYFIEVNQSMIDKIPSNFIFKQSLTQVLRYTSDELLKFENDIFNANDNLLSLEKDIFFDICSNIELHFNDILLLNKNISELDFYSNAAFISKNKNYITPEILKNYSLEIKWWKHPVIQEVEKDFVSNDLSLFKKDSSHIITWPNMWGKSTYLRQNALCIIMSHVWLDIPAQSAKIGIVDKVFSRIGSGDNLYMWQSTFMVEMQEISYIVHHATQNSFVIIDEIWRWTSTYDWMSLAWAILEYIHTLIWSKLLFATHYHEIVDYTYDLKGASNYSVVVSENTENIVFLRKVVPGGMKKSYGIEVAKLSWIPNEILSNARQTMKKLQENWKVQQFSFPDVTVQNKLPSELSEILDNICEIDINTTSPISALETLNSFQKQIKKIK